MSPIDAETVFVCGERVLVVRQSSADGGRATRVTVEVDGRFEWSFEEPGWRPISFGAGQDLPYVWSARTLISFPGPAHQEPDVVRVDAADLDHARTIADPLHDHELHGRLVYETGRTLERPH